MRAQLGLGVMMLVLNAAPTPAQSPNGSEPPCPRGVAGRPKMTLSAGAKPRMTVTYAATSLSFVFADIELASKQSIVRSLAVDTIRISVRFIATPWDTALASVL